VEALTSALEAKSLYTRGHSDRVADISSMISEKLGYDEEQTQQVHIAAHLHDIGKIGICDSILNSPAKLTREEYKEMQKHPLIGDEILSRVNSLLPYRDAVKHHHERWDGAGYPDGLAREEIHPWARIISIADSFNAMVSRRAYRETISISAAILDIRKNAGKQFDPRIVEALLRISGEEIAKPYHGIKGEYTKALYSVNAN
jgi:HD-GYP domain-containing protein (c-di-GMP phosphodiesterase class II)